MIASNLKSGVISTKVFAYKTGIIFTFVLYSTILSKNLICSSGILLPSVSMKINEYSDSLINLTDFSINSSVYSWPLTYPWPTPTVSRW